MKSIDILILYEKSVRELDVACILKIICESEYGFNVEIAQQNCCYPQVFRNYKPKLVVIPFCYQERSNNIYYNKWRDAVYFNMTWEQLLYKGNAQAKTPTGEFARKHVFHHAWSKDYADFLLALGVPAEHIYINGNPAYALYDLPYRQFYKNREKLAATYGLSLHKQWVFFPENYNWAFYGQDMLEQMVMDGQPREQVYAMREFARNSFETAMRWCCRLAKEIPVEIIIRPRPATSLEEFASRVAEVVATIPENMHVLQAESVREWILASDVVVSSYSTSLIEAAIASKNIFMVEPYPLPNDLIQAWHHLVPRVATYTEFVAACANESSEINWQPLQAWAKNHLMAGGDSIRNLADFLSKIVTGMVRCPEPASARHITLKKVSGAPWWINYPLMKAYVFLQKYRTSVPVEDCRVDVEHYGEIPVRLGKWRQILGAG